MTKLVLIHFPLGLHTKLGLLLFAYARQVYIQKRSNQTRIGVLAMGVTIEVGSDGVALIMISNPPVNALAPSILERLKERYVEAMNRDDVRAIVLTGAGGRFSGGFDINIFRSIQKSGDLSIFPDISVGLVINTIEDGKKPSVAAIDGLALGGGLELAMGCQARISTPKAHLGLPELTLGTIPGYGGTQRLPRLVGMSKAIEMMMTSKSIMSEEGRKLGLIDAVVSSEELLRVARQWALAIAERQKPWIKSLRRTDRLGSLSEARATLKAARKHADIIAPNLPQHRVCLDVMEEGIVSGGYSGVLKESKQSNELVLSSTSRGLVHVFFAQRSASKVPDVTDVRRKPRDIKKVGVLGGSPMGSEITTALIVSNILVVLWEVTTDRLQKGMQMIEANLRELVMRGEMTEAKAKTAFSNVKGVLDFSQFKNMDMVIETVVGEDSLRQSIFSELETVCSPTCILASASTLNLNVVGERTTSQDRIVGAHFFSRAHVMPLLEIARTEKTAPQVILDLITVGKRLKKVPVVVGNCTGFAVKRTFFPYTQGAHILAHLGVDMFRIDRVISNFGMPVGPFQLQDFAGYGEVMELEKKFEASFGDRTFRSSLLEILAKSGRNGKSSGKGYYIYEEGRKPEPDPSLQPFIEDSRRLMHIVPNAKLTSISDQEIMEMILFPVVNEACRVIEEGIVLRASDLDIASVLGMGFPKYRGGIVFWGDSIGAGYICSSLEKWSESYGNFFKPSRFLVERAKKGISLSEPASSYQSAMCHL